MNEDKVWTVILIVSVLLMFSGLQDVADPDKKTAQAGISNVNVGAAGVVAFGFKKTIASLAPLALLSVGFWRVIIWPVTAFVTFFANKGLNIFSSQPTISPLVWVAAFFVLALLVLKKSK